MYKKYYIKKKYLANCIFKIFFIMSLNNRKKRKAHCYCAKCEGAIVPETTAKRHQINKQYQDTRLNTIVINSKNNT
jgi:hypothetical protein